MLIKNYKSQFVTQLLPIYDAQEVESFFYLIMENKRQLRRIDLALDINLAFSETEIQEWNSILGKLKLQIPIQYILGST